jgi:hypothetical protein
MEEVDAEISEMKLFLNGRARFVAEGYLAQVIHVLAFYTDMLVHIIYTFSVYFAGCSTKPILISKISSAIKSSVKALSLV